MPGKKHSSFVTPKGTDLPLLDLHGKPYLQVAHRLVWFREEHPDWAICTSIYDWDKEKKWAVCRAVILDSEGRIIAEATKSENVTGFADYLEKAETGAIGRALALCGYGTQFTADELDEGDRIVDSPIARAATEVAATDVAFESDYGTAPDCMNGHGALQIRTVKATGRAFWGCTAYPTCKNTKPATLQAPRQLPFEETPPPPDDAPF